MAKKKYRMHVSDGSMDWTEDYYFSDPKEAQKMIDEYNQILRPKENARTLISVKEIDPGDETITSWKRVHSWEKTNYITVSGRDGSLYDIYRCSVCGITGKRYGLSSEIARDPKFKAKKYEYCKEG